MEKTSRTAMTDLELVEKIRNGSKFESEKAFRMLFDKYHKLLLLNFKRLAPDEEAAEGIVLEAFQKMNSNLEKYNQDTAVFSTWFFKITSNLFVDRSRKKTAEVVFLTDLSTVNDENEEMTFDPTSSDSSPEEKLLIKERNAKIRNIIDAMKNKKLSKLLILRYFDGFSYAQIAEITKRPIGTVKVSLMRAKLTIKEDFERADLIL